MQLAQSYLQGMGSPFDGVLEAYGQGLQNKRYSNQTDLIKAQQDREQQAYLDLDSVDWDDLNAVGQVMARYPEHAKGAKDYYNSMEAKEQQSLLLDMSRSISALGSDRPDIAVQSMRDKASAYNDMGMAEKAEEYSQMAEWMATDPQGARRALQMNYAVIAGDKATSGYKSLVDTDIAENESPYTIAEKVANADGTQATAFKTRADATDTVSEGLSTAAIGGNAGTFSLKAGMMHAQGLITDAQKEYIDERLNNDDPEAVQVFLEGLAGQNVEIAKLNKPETSVVNAGGQLVAIRKNADGSVEIVGSVDKTIDPTAQYTTDAGTENNIRNNNTQIDIANQRDATTRQSQELQKYLADQKAEESRGTVTRQVMPDGRVLLFDKQGNWKPVIDANGKPMISKPSIADKPLNESQGNSLMYGKRMQTAHKILEDLENSGTIRGWSLTGVKNEDQRKYEQAQRNFINAILRKESGAVIADSEFDNAKKQYFPAFWDSEEVIKQKAANRAQVIKSMLTNAGPKGEAAITKPVNTSKWVK